MKSELGSKMNYASQFEAAEPEPMVTVSLVAGLTTPPPPVLGTCPGVCSTAGLQLSRPRCPAAAFCSQDCSGLATAGIPGSLACREIRYFKVTKELIAI